MSLDRSKPNREINPLHPSEGDEIAMGKMQALDRGASSQFIVKQIGEISEKTNGLSDENSRLREKIEALKKENHTLKQKIEAMENQNHKQGETIRILESSQERLQNELEDVKKAKDRLRIEFSAENQILAVKLEAVENENKELKHRLEELANSNNSLKQTVDTIKKENQQLKDDVGKICEKLERKETRLALGQVAWMLEVEIWKVVLPDQKMGVAGILNSMERWLKKNYSSVEGKAAQKRWDDLKGKLNWEEDDHKRVLSCLKKLRRVDAHPDNVDLEVARKQLNEGDYVADMEKKSCEEIIDMVATAKMLNNSK